MCPVHLGEAFVLFLICNKLDAVYNTVYNAVYNTVYIQRCIQHCPTFALNEETGAGVLGTSAQSHLTQSQHYSYRPHAQTDMSRTTTSYTHTQTHSKLEHMTELIT